MKMGKGMASHEVLKSVCEKFKYGAKGLAQGLKLSLALIHRWSRPRGNAGTGALNPLDRVLEIIRLTGNELPLDWLCAQCGGEFKRRPARLTGPAPTRDALTVEFAELLAAIARSAQAGTMTPEQVAALRVRADGLHQDVGRYLAAMEAEVLTANMPAAESKRRNGRCFPLPSLLLSLPLWWPEPLVESAFAFSA